MREETIVKVPNVLILKDKTKLNKWACVACDQFTSEKDYWDDVLNITKNEYSTYHITFPEIFLQKEENESVEDTNSRIDAKIEKINEYMYNYLNSNIFEEINSFILVERKTKHSLLPRYGLMIMIDLEAYSYEPFNDHKIKATEDTILERLPVRIKIREKAPLEIPHIMLLLNDQKKCLIESCIKKKQLYEKCYDFELIKDGGHIIGYKVDDPDNIFVGLEKIEQGLKKEDFLFAVGDGNHSLATAKCCWDKIKKNYKDEKILKNHPARYALVELINLYDDALIFQPIHRVIINYTEEFLNGIFSIFGSEICFDPYSNTCFFKPSNDPIFQIERVQKYIDKYIINHPETIVDYIHGNEHLKEVVKIKKGLGIIMPDIDKSKLFPYVIEKGVLPKKAFSMGEAEEKRYYLEAKKIKFGV